MSVARWVLLALLVFLPFQRTAAQWLEQLRWVDEAVLAALLPFVFVRRRRAPLFAGERLFAGAIALVGIVGLVSAWSNGVPAWPALLGTADYVKGFAYFAVFAAMGGDPRWWRRAYRVLLVLALLAASCALGQEVLRLWSGGPGEVRLGLYRVPGFLGHPNRMGLYLLVFFLLESARRPRPGARVVLLYAGAFLSLSRMVHTACVVLSALQLRRRWWLTAPILASLVFVAGTLDLTVRDVGRGGGTASAPTRPTYRAYARERALAVWRDHRTLGAGPGRFGGVVSLRYGSPVYDRAPWDPRYRAYLERLRSLDQFPPQLLAELGIAGAVAFTLLYLSVLRALWLVRRRPETRGLMLVVGIIPFYCLGSGLNLAAVLVTIMALAGAHAGQCAAENTSTSRGTIASQP